MQKTSVAEHRLADTFVWISWIIQYLTIGKPIMLTILTELIIAPIYTEVKLIESQHVISSNVA